MDRPGFGVDWWVGPIGAICGRFWGLIVVFWGQVLKRDIPWETYMTAKLINSTGLQLLRRYDHRPYNVQAALLEEVFRDFPFGGIGGWIETCGAHQRGSTEMVAQLEWIHPCAAEPNSAV